jgi:hypothetical protein
MTQLREPMMPGARVHYVRDSSGDEAFPRVCRAALVTRVSTIDGSGEADLVVFDSEGFRNKRRVDYDSDVKPLGGTWHWPDPETQQCRLGTQAEAWGLS